MRIDAGIPRDSFVNVVREDPAARVCSMPAPSAACSCRSTTARIGSRCKQNLPMTSVRDIDVHGDDLVIATHGRGFWIMDDVSALRQMGSLHSDEVALVQTGDRHPRAPRPVSPARPCPRMSLWRPILPTVR